MVFEVLYLFKRSLSGDEGDVADRLGLGATDILLFSGFSVVFSVTICSPTGL